jgi:NADH-quinone oxidoreductase subunit G
MPEVTSIMPKLVIDEQEIEVPSGTKVIEAAEQLGIMIPRFCYHPALGSVGACRVCAVKFLKGDFKGIQMSCMIDAKDDMVVSTTDEEAVDFRQHIIEWLMLHHPHDCPACDEGGHCLLQDMTVAGGHGLRRYLGQKRTYRDQVLGPLIQHEMNRCIHCYRCSRFYQDFCGYDDLGVMQIANRTYFGRYRNGPLESPFSGNLIDICPTGVYTDKPSRYVGRRWDYEREPSLCIQCSLGCHVTVNARYREVVRQEAAFSDTVNGHFICDRGRYGYAYTNREDRPREVRVKSEAVSWETGLKHAAESIHKITRNAGSRAVACATSLRSNLETKALLRQISQYFGWSKPAYWTDPFTAAKVRAAVSRLEPDLCCSLRDIEKADLILVVNADPVNEAPMLALALRQAQRNGAHVVVLDPRPVALPVDFKHIPLCERHVLLGLALLIKGSVTPQTAQTLGQYGSEFYKNITNAPDAVDLNEVSQLVKESHQPVLVCGTQSMSEEVIHMVADYAVVLLEAERKVGLFYLFPGADAFGAVLTENEADSLESLLESIEGGRIQALILVESDPFHGCSHRSRVTETFKRLELLVVLDYLDSAAVRGADIVLPTATIYESGGIFINSEGRVQQSRAVHCGGEPIRLSGGGNHPPRLFRAAGTDRGPRPACQALSALCGVLSDWRPELDPDGLQQLLAKTHPALAHLPPPKLYPQEGLRVNAAEDARRRVCSAGLKHSMLSSEENDCLEIILTDWTFATEELCGHSPSLVKMEPAACLYMHPEDAECLAVKNQQSITISTDQGELEVIVDIRENMSPGVLVLPRHRRLCWQIFKPGRIFIAKDQIRAVSSKRQDKNGRAEEPQG